MRIDDYRTFWPEEESTPAPRPQPRPRRRTVQRGTAYMRGIGPHVALYYLLGAVLGLTLTIGGLGLLGLIGILFGL